MSSPITRRLSNNQLVYIKRVNNADSGTSTQWGGDNLDNIDKLLDDVDIEGITGKPAKINTKVEFRDNKLYLWNGTNTFKYNIRPGILSGNVDLELPDLTTSTGKLIAAGGANDWGTALQTFRSSNIALRNPANSASYIIVTSAIGATRIITLPPLTADDSFTFNNFPSSLLNKTLNFDLNTFKHSTTNAQGDLYKYDAVQAKLIRVPRGTADQFLKVNAAGTDIGYETVSAGGGGSADKVKVYEGGVLVGTVARKLNFNASDFVCTADTLNDEIDVSLTTPGGGGGSSADELYSNLSTGNGKKYGFWNGQSGLTGYGLLSELQMFDVFPSPYIDTTNGFTGSTWTISGTNAAGWATTYPITIRKLDPDVTFAFLLDEAGDNTGSRFYAGFASTGNVTKDSSFLDSLSGVCMFKHSNDNFFQMNHNDGSGTAVEDGSILTTNSGFHTIRIFAEEASARFGWQLDDGSINFINTEIPSSTAQLHVVFNASDDDSTTRNLRGFWAKMKMKERA